MVSTQLPTLAPSDHHPLHAGCPGCRLCDDDAALALGIEIELRAAVLPDAPALDPCVCGSCPACLARVARHLASFPGPERSVRTLQAADIARRSIDRTTRHSGDGNRLAVFAPAAPVAPVGPAAFFDAFPGTVNDERFASSFDDRDDHDGIDPETYAADDGHFNLGWALAYAGILAACPSDASKGERESFFIGTVQGEQARREVLAMERAEMEDVWDRWDALERDIERDEEMRGDWAAGWHEDEARRAGHGAAWAMERGAM